MKTLLKIGISFDLADEITPYFDTDDASDEYDSLDTVNSIKQVLEQRFEVVLLGGGEKFIRETLKERPDIVFNISEGRGNTRTRECQVPAILEMLGIPYSGSDPLTLSLALDKIAAKKWAIFHNIPTPDFEVISSLDDIKKVERLGFPLILKPSHEGSSIGVRRVDSKIELEEKTEFMLEKYKQKIIAEKYLEGEDFTVGMLTNKIIGTLKIKMKKDENGKNFIYGSYEKKHCLEILDYILYNGEKKEEIESIAEKCCKIFEVKDFCRVDIKYSNGKPFFLEINPLPGLNPQKGDLVILASKKGISYSELIFAILESAMKRYNML